MFVVGPTFFSSPGGGGTLTPGTPTPSAIAVSGTPCICPIDGTRALVIYQDASTFFLMGVVITVTGGVPSFGTPVALSGASRVPLSVRMLNAGTGEFVAFSRFTANAFARIIVVTGTVITTPNAEASSAVLTSPNRGYGEVLSTGQGGVVIEDTVAGIQKVWGIACTFAAGAVTFGTPVVSTMFSLGGGGSRPVLYSGQLVQFGMDVSGSPSYLAAVGFTMAGTTCIPSTMYLPTLVADRIRADAANSTGGTTDANGGVVALLYQDFGTGNIASVRGAWSGSAASYSNSDSSKNILTGGPFTPPTATEIQGYGQVSPAGSYGTLFTRIAGAIKLYPIGIAGNVNMAGAGVVLVASGAGAQRPGHVYMSSTQILYIYVITAGSLLGAGTCGVS